MPSAATSTRWVSLGGGRRRRGAPAAPLQQPRSTPPDARCPPCRGPARAPAELGGPVPGPRGQPELDGPLPAGLRELRGAARGAPGPALRPASLQHPLAAPNAARKPRPCRPRLRSPRAARTSAPGERRCPTYGASRPMSAPRGLRPPRPQCPHASRHPPPSPCSLADPAVDFPLLFDEPEHDEQQVGPRSPPLRRHI